MKTYRTPNRRAFAALIPATLLMAAPAFAQDAQTVAPPPVVTAAPPAAPPAAPVQSVTPPRVVATVPAAPVAEEAAPATDTAAPVARRAPRRAPTAVARPVAAAPVSTAVPAEAPPVPAAPPPPVAEAAAPVTPSPAPQADAPAETPPTSTDAAPIWPWIVGGLLVLVGIGLFLMRRRRPVEEAYYDEETSAEPMIAPAAPATAREPQFLRPATIAPAAAAPAFVPTDAEAEQTASEAIAIATPDADDVAALTAHAPVGERPWLEFAMRPLRAGTNVDEAMVEIELTIGNSGSVAATDVRVSTFMFASGPGDATGMERDLIERHAASDVPPITIAPGEGTRVDATLALPKAELMARDGGTFSPVVVADARYTLPDGSEGRTSASFRIGLSDANGAAMTPFPVDDKAMHDDIEAELYGTPERA